MDPVRPHVEARTLPLAREGLSKISIRFFDIVCVIQADLDIGEVCVRFSRHDVELRCQMA